jgi:uncharacterized protein (TIGR00730 family)
MKTLYILLFFFLQNALSDTLPAMAPTQGLTPLDQLSSIAIDNNTALLDEERLAAGISQATTPNGAPITPLLDPRDSAIHRTTMQGDSLTIGAEEGKPAPTTICVFCGSSSGDSPEYLEAARGLAKVFHDRNIKLVYGGGTVGLMGEIARTLVSLSGPDSVHGIIPAPLVKYEQGPDSEGPTNGGLPEEHKYGQTTVVRDMHTRKQMMAQAVMRGGPGSGFIALPGGFGTMEELMEVTTWNQLGIHSRGVVMLNIKGYYDGILQWVKKSIEAGFVRPNCKDILVTANTPEDAVDFLADYKSAEGRFKLEWGTM